MSRCWWAWHICQQTAGLRAMRSSRRTCCAPALRTPRARCCAQCSWTMVRPLQPLLVGFPPNCASVLSVNVQSLSPAGTPCRCCRAAWAWNPAATCRIGDRLHVSEMRCLLRQFSVEFRAVPKRLRARFNALESVKSFGWSGSAAAGGCAAHSQP